MYALPARPFKSAAVALFCIGVLISVGPSFAQSPPQRLSDEEAVKFALEWAMAAKQSDTNQLRDRVLDVTITAVTVGFPPAGVSLGLFKSFLFGLAASPDPVQQALNVLNGRVSSLESRMLAAERAVAQIRDEQFRTQNTLRLRELQARRGQLNDLRRALALRPTGNAATNLVESTLEKADRFLPNSVDDEDMWQWSDLRVVNDPATGNVSSEMLQADFKTVPMLDAYMESLVLVIAAIEQAGTDDREAVKRRYGPRLRRHTAFLSQNPPEQKDKWPIPLPQRIDDRVNCELVSLNRQPGPDRLCTWRWQCRDAIQRRSEFLGNLRTRTMANQNELCAINVPGKPPEEEGWEAEHGLPVIALAASTLQRLVDHGSVKEQLVGKFEMKLFNPQYLYAVRSNGELLWFAHDMVADASAPPAGLHIEKGLGIETLTEHSPATAALGGTRPDPSVVPNKKVSPERLLRPRGKTPTITHTLNGPRSVGQGWTSFKDALPAGVYGLRVAVYGLKQNGDLLWYRHDDYRGGLPNWKGPVLVGTGWTSFSKIIAAGDGILYAVADDGTLYWYRHLDAADTSEQAKWTARKAVGTGWNSFTHVFSTGEGVIYGVKPDGTLLWYRHKGYMSGSSEWTESKQVGTGWAGFKRIFSTGSGYIYAIAQNGDLYAYHHIGFKDGTPTWDPNKIIASGWDEFVFAFPAMWGTPVFKGPN